MQEVGCVQKVSWLSMDWQLADRSLLAVQGQLGRSNQGAAVYSTTSETEEVLELSLPTHTARYSGAYRTHAAQRG